MSNVICSKCSAKADSKCPYCRTVFPDNQIESMLTWLLKFEVSKDGWVKLSYAPPSGWQTKTEAELVENAFTNLHNILSRMADPASGYPSFAQYACIHQWVFAPGCGPTIDCGHGPQRKET